MTEQDIITPDLIEDAEYVSKAWRMASQSRLEGIFKTGRRLIEIRNKYKDDDGNWKKEHVGKWSRLIGDNQWKGQSLLPFEKSQTQMLVRVAECKRLPRHVGVLPDDGYTLSKLVSLPDERWQELLRYRLANKLAPKFADSRTPSSFRRWQLATVRCGRACAFR